MSAAIRLGMRLAFRAGPSGRRRVAMTLVGLGVGALIVMIAMALTARVSQAAACEPGDRVCQAQVQLMGFAFFGVPGVVLLAAAARLAARGRDRQLAGLRQLGFGARGVRVAVAAEAVVLAVIATLGAATVLAAVLRWGPFDASLVLDARAVALGMVIVLVTVLVVVTVGTGRVVADPTGVVRDRVEAMPSTWRVAPVVAGLLVVAVPAVLSPVDGVSGLRGLAWIVGILAMLVGLPLAFPVLIHRLGVALATAGARPLRRLVGRGLQQHGLVTSRVLATLMTMVATAVFVQGLWYDYASGPLTAGAVRAQTTGPNDAVVTLPQRSPIPVDIEGTVLDVRPLQIANCLDDTCMGVLIATCAQYRHLVEDPSAWCDPTTPFVYPDDVLTPEGELVVADRVDQAGRPMTVPAARTIGERPQDHDPDGVPTRGDAIRGQIQMVAPPSVVTGIDDGAYQWVVSLTPGLQHLTELEQLLPGSTVAAVSGGLDEYETAMTYRTAVLGALLTAAAAALIGLALAGVDGALTRRDTARRLSNLGMSRRTIAWSYLLQHALPLLIGIPLAAALGALGFGLTLYHPVPGVTVHPVALAAQVALAATAGGLAVLAVIGAALVGRGTPRHEL